MGNHAEKNFGELAGSVLEWSDVLRAVPGSKTRAALLARFFDRGFDAGSFGAKRSAREAMVADLTATEDWLGLGPPNALARARIRDLRRRLELELWP